MSTPDFSIGLLGLPSLAAAVTQAGYIATTSEDRRTAATAIREAVLAAATEQKTYPVLVSDEAWPGHRAWTIKLAEEVGARVVVVRIASGASHVDFPGVTETSLPATLGQVMAAAGLGVHPSMADIPVDAEGQVAGFEIAAQEPAPAPEAPPAPEPVPEPVVEVVAPAPVPDPEPTSEPVVAVPAEPTEPVSPVASPAPEDPAAIADPVVENYQAQHLAARPEVFPPASPVAEPVQSSYDPTPLAAPATPEPEYQPVSVAPAHEEMADPYAQPPQPVAPQAYEAPVAPPAPVAPVQVAPLAQPVPAHEPIAEPQAYQAPPAPVAPVAQPVIPADPYAQQTVPAQPTFAHSAQVPPATAPVHANAPAAGKRGEVIVVTSGKGGVGKSSTSSGIAQRAAERGLRVVLVDGNFGQGDLRTYLRVGTAGLPSIHDYALTRNLENTLVTPDQINAARDPQQSRLGFAFIQAPPFTHVAESVVTPDVYLQAIEEARSHADLVVVDTQIITGEDTSGMVEGFLLPLFSSGAWQVGLTDLSTPGVGNLLEVFKRLSRLGVPDDRRLSMMNRVPESQLYQAERLEQAMSEHATLVGTMLASPELGEAMNKGNSSATVAGFQPFLDKIVTAVFPHSMGAAPDSSMNVRAEPERKRKRRSLFSRRQK